jgi:NADH-quinone oxidoreductase subunit A
MHVHLIPPYAFYYALVGGYVLLGLLVTFVMVFLAVAVRYLSLRRPDSELAAAYECGFLPFDRDRTKFEVKFFMVGLLFVLFDLEVVFVLPWAIAVPLYSLISFFFFFFFLALLAVGFVYELAQRALEF